MEAIPIPCPGGLGNQSLDAINACARRVSGSSTYLQASRISWYTLQEATVSRQRMASSVYTPILGIRLNGLVRPRLSVCVCVYHRFMKEKYTPFLLSTRGKVLVLLGTAALLAAGMYGVTQVGRTS